MITYHNYTSLVMVFYEATTRVYTCQQHRLFVRPKCRPTAIKYKIYIKELPQLTVTVQLPPLDIHIRLEEILIANVIAACPF